MNTFLAPPTSAIAQLLGATGDPPLISKLRTVDHGPSVPALLARTRHQWVRSVGTTTLGSAGNYVHIEFTDAGETSVVLAYAWLRVHRVGLK